MGKVSGSNDFFDDFDKRFEDHKKMMKTTTKAAAGCLIAGVILKLAVIGVVVWAIIMLVNHFKP